MVVVGGRKMLGKRESPQMRSRADAMGANSKEGRGRVRESVSLTLTLYSHRPRPSHVLTVPFISSTMSGGVKLDKQTRQKLDVSRVRTQVK